MSSDIREIDDILNRTLADRALSRGEKKALRSVLDDLAPGSHEMELIRDRAFSAAREALRDGRDREVLDWLDSVIGLLASHGKSGAGRALAEAVFSPGSACRQRIAGLISGARERVDICVYTITDDRVARAVEDAHGRGRAVRIITDDEKSSDSGSDISRFRGAGIPVAFDDSAYQMHHKFAVIDGEILVTGSYNWTRAAAEQNQENIVVTDDARLVRSFAAEFERLWGTFYR